MCTKGMAMIGRGLAPVPTAGDQHRRFATVAEAGDGVERHVPSLVGIPPTDLGEHDPVRQRGPDRSQLARLDGFEEVVWDTVRHHEGIHAMRPQQVLHRPRDGEDRGRVAKSSEVDAIEPEPVVRSPRQHRAVTQSSTHELVVNGNERPHGVPILGQDHCSPAGRAISADDPGEMAGQPDAPILDLAFLVAVDAGRAFAEMAWLQRFWTTPSRSSTPGRSGSPTKKRSTTAPRSASARARFVTLTPSPPADEYRSGPSNDRCTNRSCDRSSAGPAAVATSDS